ncbi:MAG TPA: triple tyrosine motif-containing protein, partial [Bacteroidales bacterium]|nr:triple tyrosine motif-containing protein [Bacteroidales bacterium]
VGDSLENDEFWKIVEHENSVYFQSFGKILRYHNNSVESIPLPGSIMFLIECNNRLFYQMIDGGLYEVSGVTVSPIPNSELFRNTEVKAILPFDHQRMLIGTNSKGLFLFDGNDFQEWPNDASDQLKTFKINNGTRVGDYLVFGTIMRGVFILDLNGELVYHLHTGYGLQNNTVLALRSDDENNLWVGLDNGFDYVSFNTPVKSFLKNDPDFGAVYTAILHKNQLFVGTNQGLFSFSIDKDMNISDMQLVPQSQGQVWFLKKIDGKIYGGLNEGTYLVANNQLIEVSSINGGYNLQKVNTPIGEILLQSTYTSIVVYKQSDGMWKEAQQLVGFEAPARFLEVDHTNNILLGHAISGIFIVEPNRYYNAVASIKRAHESIEVDASLNRIYKVDNRVVIPTGTNLLQWDPVSGRATPWNSLNNQLLGFESATTIIPASPFRYWFIKDHEFGLFEIRFETATLIYRLIPEMYDIRLVENYENIVTLNDSLFLICQEDGFSILNLNLVKRQPARNQPPQIKNLIFGKTPNMDQSITLNINNSNTLRHRFNNVQIIFTSSGPAGKKQYFQYRLEGLDENWSQWDTKPDVLYNRLPQGEYTFYLRTMNNYGIATQATTVQFHVVPQWFASYYAFVAYFLLTGVMAWFIRQKYMQMRWRKREAVLKQNQDKILQEKERTERELIRITNDKLQTEISLKNNQLANTTMTLIRKNELLTEMQEHLHQMKQELGTRFPHKHFTRLNRLIESNIKSDKDWEIFEKLFDQAHENFFQRLKSDSPDLTSSDLRLCAYLRLSLSSKEIAPLLNISVRGVEERRYRLRKRLKLTSEQNLSEFILAY